MPGVDSQISKYSCVIVLVGKDYELVTGGEIPLHCGYNWQVPFYMNLMWWSIRAQSQVTSIPARVVWHIGAGVGPLCVRAMSWTGSNFTQDMN